MHFRDALVVALEEALEDLGEEYPLVHPDAAHDAVVDQHQPPIRRQDHVPFVQVGMEEAVVERAGEEPARHAIGEIDALFRGQGPRIGQRPPLDPFRCQHALTGALPVDLRGMDVAVDGRDLGKF